MVERTTEEYRETFKWFGREIADRLKEATQNARTDQEARENRLDILREYCQKGNPGRYGSVANDKANFTL